MKKYILFIVIFILILFLLQASGPTQKIEWNEFVWAGSTIGEEYYNKAAILVPFKFNGIEEDYYLQLDTGALSVLYGNSFHDIEPSHRVKKEKDKRPSIISIDGILSNYEFTNEDFGLLQDYGPTLEELKVAEYKLIGSLGIDFFKNRILIIDFSEEKFAILNDQNDIPRDIKKNSGFLDMKYKNEKIYLTSKIGGKDLSLIYDTGSSIFDIIATKEIWTSLTKIKSAKDMKLLEIPAWGDIVQLKGARSESDWEIGDVTIEKPLIFYEPSGLENFNFKSIQADGLLGNAIFYDNHVIIIDLISKKFGIMEVEP
ncbi:hypothetical protein [Tissierella sp.]|uniref:hypothetical protein n=1 Tax=Tissierella sp. TaxID=41274 RepID=UPI00286100B9|nr:hypothetical protein [Tissierella sp.]MDR7857893.1 hypothetical protein [Tissierella sp.]